MRSLRLIEGDALAGLREIPDGSVHCCVTSPPYWGLRDYHVAGQLGLEPTPGAYVENMVAVFREVRRVLRDDGTLWLNLGDSYAAQGGAQVNGTKQVHGSQDGAWNGKTRRPPEGLKPKDLVGIPWRVALALQADGWYLRSDVIWHKPNSMPERVADRPTKAHEYLFLLSKSERYHYDADAIREDHATPLARRSTKQGRSCFQGQAAIRPRGNLEAVEDPADRYYAAGGRNRRTVWTIPTEPFPGAHFAVMPTELVKPCILAGCPTGGTVLDPFGGSGTVAVVALEHGCSAILCELNPEYCEIIRKRVGNTTPATLLGGGS